MEYIKHFVEAAPPLLSVGILTVMGYYLGRLVQKTRLPSLIGYMLVGVVLGPSLFELFHEENLRSMEFITEIVLGFVAFTIGSELSLKALRRLGMGIVSIIFAESFGAFTIVLAGMYLLTSDLPMSLIFASMAPASAPAGTVAVIQEYKAKGSLTTALYAVVGFDDGLAILIFGFASALAKSMLEAETSEVTTSIVTTLMGPLKEIILSLIVGTILGVLFGVLVRKLTNIRDSLILSFGFILIGCGLSTMMHLSLILTNLVIGFILVNTRSHDLVRRVGEEMGRVMPLQFILFFAMAGAHLKLSALKSLGLIGVVYILTRTVGLIFGARMGAMVGHVEDKIKKYVGLGILSQAGVAIGLALIVMKEFTGLGANGHGKDIGLTVISTITATCIFFEVIGPICAKYALSKAGEIKADDTQK